MLSLHRGRLFLEGQAPHYPRCNGARILITRRHSEIKGFVNFSRFGKHLYETVKFSLGRRSTPSVLPTSVRALRADGCQPTTPPKFEECAASAEPAPFPPSRECRAALQLSPDQPFDYPRRLVDVQVAPCEQAYCLRLADRCYSKLYGSSLCPCDKLSAWQDFHLTYSQPSKLCRPRA